MPDWITWSNLGKLLAVVPGWIAFFFTVRKAWFERTLLEFTLQATNVEVDEDDQTNRFIDGAGMVRALHIDVTNNGLRPITIRRFECVFAFLNKKEERREFKSTAWSDKKIGQGDHCVGFLKVHAPPMEIVSACVIDSTGKRWPVPSRNLKSLNDRGPKQWS
ncbi:MAG: hypothetical protein ABSE56_23760 [Bryobacteraceae bacterium]|jgi:hypothetical protein